MKFTLLRLALLGLVSIFAISGTAAASAITLNYETLANTNNGNHAVTSTYTTNAQVLTIPGSTGFIRTFTAPQAIIQNSLAGNGFGFLDTYLFTIDSATVNSITSSIDLGKFLGIQNLSEQLFSFNESNPAQFNVEGTPVALGNPIQSLTALNTNGSGAVAVIQQTNLATGTYALQISGIATGQFGGTYVSVLNLSPSFAPVSTSAVPVPAALWLMGSALLGIVSVSKRKQV
ncbi:MAG: hypothetical protein WC782_01195 [Methylococcaceae bacterium]|jgi:hypothetical protein